MIMMTTDFLPLISVIVPVYHAERYLDRCIKSILSQAEANIELWLIDDGSPDQCGNMCDTFAQKDSRVHVIHKKNAGVSSARNDGIKRALGKYIAFVDADDYIEPNMLSLLLSLAERTMADIAICGYYIERGHMQKPVNLCCDDGDYNKTDVEQLLFKFFGRDCTGLASMCNKLYLRSFRFLYKGIIIKHNKTEPTYTKTSLFLCEKRRFFMARTEKGVVATI